MAHSSDLPVSLQSLQQRLSTLLAHIRESGSEKSWLEVESVSRALADALRVRDGPSKTTSMCPRSIHLNTHSVDNHTILGKTLLPQDLTSLFTLSLHDSTTPEEKYTSVVFELLRVAANFCMDHGKFSFSKKIS